jgi:hypothetical protein
VSLTHYWHRRGPFTRERFNQAVSDCKRVCESERFEDLLAGWDGTGDPIFTESQISFNGVDDKGLETFSVEQDATHGIQSCKTGGFPYDMAIRCCLLILRHHLPEEIEISSDDRNPRKWVDAQEIVNEVLEWDEEFELDAVD